MRAAGNSGGWVLATAAIDQTAAVLSLLQELIAAPVLPSRFAVVHAVGSPSCLWGAAAFVPWLQHHDPPGFTAQCRVLPAFRRRGAGRALVGWLAEEALRWDVGALHAWQPEPEGEAAAFLRACGFRPHLRWHDFMGDVARTRAECQRLLHRLRARRRVPDGVQLVPLDTVPLGWLAQLYGQHAGGAPASHITTLKQLLAAPAAAATSVGLIHRERLVGFLLAADKGRGLEVLHWLIDPAFRHGWPAVMLLEDFLRRALEVGVLEARYSCSETALATLNLARSTEARDMGLRDAYVLDLGHDGRVT